MALEASIGCRTDATDDPELALTNILIEAYYNGREPKLTPEQEQMLRDTLQWFRDEGLWDLYFGADDPLGEILSAGLLPWKKAQALSSMIWRIL